MAAMLRSLGFDVVNGHVVALLGRDFGQRLEHEGLVCVWAAVARHACSLAILRVLRRAEEGGEEDGHDGLDAREAAADDANVELKDHYYPDCCSMPWRKFVSDLGSYGGEEGGGERTEHVVGFEKDLEVVHP